MHFCTWLLAAILETFAVRHAFFKEIHQRCCQALSRVLALVALLLLLASVGWITFILMHPLQLGRLLLMIVLAWFAWCYSGPDLSADGRLSMYFEGSFGGADGGRMIAPILLDPGASITLVTLACWSSWLCPTLLPLPS